MKKAINARPVNNIKMKNIEGMEQRARQAVKISASLGNDIDVLLMATS